MTNIDVFQFSDSRQYLKSVIFEKQVVGLRELARRSGFQSPALLSLVCSGKKRWTLNSAEGVANGLGLSGRRREYFLNLARLDRVKSIDEELELRSRLSLNRVIQDEQQLTRSQLRCLSRWYYPALMVLMRTKGFRQDADWIAKRLGPSVTPRLVKEALGDLLNVGLVTRDAQGKLLLTSTPLSTGDECESVAVRAYHRDTIRLAELALNQPLEDREITGLTLDLPRAKLPLLKKRIRDFVRQLNEELSNEAETEEVYQLNVQLFALSHVVGEGQS